MADELLNRRAPQKPPFRRKPFTCRRGAAWFQEAVESTRITRRTVMMAGASREGLVGFNRFGLGPRPGDLARIPADPRGLLKAELQPDKAQIEPASATPALTGTATNIQIAYAAQEASKMERRASDRGCKPAGLDNALESLEAGLGQHWKDTTVVVMTELAGRPG